MIERTHRRAGRVGEPLRPPRCAAAHAGGIGSVGRLLALGIGSAARSLALGIGSAARSLALGIGSAARSLALGIGCVAWLLSVGLASTALAVGDRGADGAFERRDSFHFTLYQDVDIDQSGGFYGSRKFEQEILDRLEEAFDRLDRILDLRPAEKLVVYVWDPALFDQRYAGLFRFPAAGFYGGAIHIRGGTRVTPQLVRVLHHELVHAAFDAEAPRIDLPAWMNEGIAEWFEARANGKRGLSRAEHDMLARLASRGALFSLAELSAPSFGAMGPDAARVAYLQSYGFIDHLVRVHGERGLVRFWSAVLRSRSLVRGAERAYKRDLLDLEQDFLRALRAG